MYSSPVLKAGFSTLAIAVAGVFVLESVAIGAGGVSVPGPGVAFTRAWRTENLAGDFSQAAEAYERLYKVPAKATPAKTGSKVSSSQLDRLRAAYRAGLCFEAIGNVRRAGFAYQWIERNYLQISTELHSKYPAGRGLRDHLSLLSERCALRSRRLKKPHAETEVEKSALNEVVREFEDYNRKDKKILEGFRQQVHEVRWRVSAADELVAQLRRAGVDVISPDRLPSSGEDAETLRSLVMALQKSEVIQGADSPLDFSSYLKRRFLHRALEALAREETDRAGREVSVSLALDNDYIPALRLQDALGRGGSISFLSEEARSSVLRQQKLHAGEVRVRARGYLVSDTGVPDRRARALRKLMSASRIFCCEPEAVIEEGELAQLIKRIQLGCLRNGGLGREESIETLLGTAREQLGTILGQAEELVALFSRSLFQKVSLSSRVDLRPEPMTVVLDLAGAIKNEMATTGEQGNRSRLERLKFKLDRLEGWFPQWKESIGGP